MKIYQLLDDEFGVHYDFSQVKKQLKGISGKPQIKVHTFEKDRTKEDLLVWLAQENQTLEEKIATSQKEIDHSGFLAFRKSSNPVDKLGYYFTKYGFVASIPLSVVLGGIEYATTKNIQFARDTALGTFALVNGATQITMEYVRNLGKFMEKSHVKSRRKKQAQNEAINSIIKNMTVEFHFDKDAAKMVKDARFTYSRFKEEMPYSFRYEVNNSLMKTYRSREHDR